MAANSQNHGDRKEGIRSAAEQLFSEYAYEAVSIRDIATKAGVNSALIRYYFGTKDELYNSLFEDRYLRIQEERRSLLNGIPADLKPVVRLREIVWAWVYPVARLAVHPTDANFLMLLARDQLRRDDEFHSTIRNSFDDLAEECLRELRSLAPGCPSETVITGYAWMVDLAIHASASRNRTERLHKKPLKTTTADQYVKELVEFIVPGLASMLQLTSQGEDALLPGA